MALSVVVTACGSGSGASSGAAGGEPVRGGTLVIAAGSTSKDLNPYPLGYQESPNKFQTLMYERLLGRDAGGNVVAGGLAESFEQPDPTTVVVKLRPGVKFHSGATMTAEDVAFTFAHLRDPATGYSTGPRYLSTLASVTADDPGTVRFTLSNADSGFLSQLASPDFVIIEKRWTQDHGNDLGTYPNGTGPFRMATFAPSTEFRAEAFADYWDPQLPYLDAVVVKTMPDVSTRVAAVRTGEADIVEFPFDQGRLLESLTGVTMVKGAPITPMMMYMSCEQEPLGDVRVRQAFMHAIDFDAIAAGVVPGETQSPSYAIPPDYPKWGVPVGPENPYAVQDIAKARQLLAAAGYPDGVTIETDVIASPEYDFTRRAVELIAQQVAPAGIRIEINALDVTTSVSRLVQGQVLASHQPQIIRADPSGYWPGYLPGNGTGCTDSTIQGLIAQERVATDDATRADLIKKISLHAQEQAFAPIMYASSYRITTIDDTVHNFTPTPDAEWRGVRAVWKTAAS